MIIISLVKLTYRLNIMPFPYFFYDLTLQGKKRKRSEELLDKRSKVQYCFFPWGWKWGANLAIHYITSKKNFQKRYSYPICYADQVDSSFYCHHFLSNVTPQLDLFKTNPKVYVLRSNTYVSWRSVSMAYALV